jgi:hypothetical protein
MSFFKKFTKGSSEKDKKEEKNDVKRKQTLVAELQKSSGLSVAFMTELKQKTEAIRLLKLENDEWSDDEDAPTPVGVDVSVAPPTPSPQQGLAAAAKGEKKLDLRAVAARMGFKKRPQKDDVRPNVPALSQKFPVRPHFLHSIKHFVRFMVV